MSTVYISLASFDDSELIPTVLDAFEKSSNPKNIFVGLHLYSNHKLRDEFVKKTNKYKNNIRLEFTEILPENFSDMVGVGKGRRRAFNLYGNEDYVLQIDPHSFFEKNWDTTLISTLEEAKAFVKNPKTILTAYAGYFKFSATGKRMWIEGFEAEENSKLLCYPYYVSDRRYYDFIPAWTLLTEKQLAALPGKFIPALKFNANFTFASGDWVAESGLDDNAEFFDEEIIQTINLMKLGYTLVYPKLSEPVVGHLYADYISGKLGHRESAASYGFPHDHVGSGIANYQKFLDDPDNSSAIAQYTRYARMHMKFGPLDKDPYIPKQFLNSEVLYEY